MEEPVTVHEVFNAAPFPKIKRKKKSQKQKLNTTEANSRLCENTTFCRLELDDMQYTKGCCGKCTSCILYYHTKDFRRLGMNYVGKELSIQHVSRKMKISEFLHFCQQWQVCFHFKKLPEKDKERIKEAHLKLPDSSINSRQ